MLTGLAIIALLVAVSSIMTENAAAAAALFSSTQPPISDLAQRLITNWETNHKSLLNEQLFVGVAGGPGSGKSSTCQDVVREIHNLQRDISAVVVPMDGFHYHTDELKEMAQQSYDNENNNGGRGTFTFDDLMLRRGAPWTFNAKECVKSFQTARRDGQASLPIYDRSISNPVQNGVMITKETKIILFEGNYLLAFDDESDWAPLANVFDDTWYIACQTLEIQHSRLLNRHLLNWSQAKIDLWGPGEEGAKKKIRESDWNNVLWVEEHCRRHAKLVVET